MNLPKILYLCLLTIALSIAVAACKKEPIDPNIPITNPQQPNPLPAHGLLKQIKWSETDHFTLTYNAQNQVEQLRLQWQYVQGDPTQIRTNLYNFQYDAQGKLMQVEQSGGWVTKYFYEGALIQKTQEIYPGGALASETVFVYANNRIVQENYRVSNAPTDPDNLYKRLLSYDVKGNLVKVEIYEQKPDLSFALVQTNIYSDFDDQLNPTNWLLRHPYLPQVRWQFNNPRKEIVQTGSDLPKTITYAYEYNAQGLPISKLENSTAGPISVQLIY